MEASLMRVLGAYFVVSALQAIPGALYMFGVQNPVGPQWHLAVVPLLQGLITAGGGMWLLRRYQPTNRGGAEAQALEPRTELVIQLFGAYFAIEGIVALVAPLSNLLVFNETWSQSLEGRVASAVASVAIGLYLVARPSVLANALKKQQAA